MNWELLSWIGVVGYILGSSVIWSLQTWFYGGRKLHSVRWIYHIFFWLGVIGFYFTNGIWISIFSMIGMSIGTFLMGIVVDWFIVPLREKSQDFMDNSKFSEEQGVYDSFKSGKDNLDNKYTKSRFYDLLFITTELKKEVENKEYLKIFNEVGDGLGWTKDRSSLERGQLKNIYILTTFGIFLKKIKIRYEEEVDEIITFMCDYFDSKLFEKTNITSEYLNVTDSSSIKEIKDQRINESDKIEMIKMWNSRIFNQVLCSYSPSYKEIYESLDEREMLEWYFDFMIDIDKDTDIMVDNYENKNDFWNMNIKRENDKSKKPDLESMNSRLDEIEKKIDNINN